MRRTQIVATIGPASETKRTLPAMLRAGADVVRVNFAHGNYAEFERIVRDTRAAAKKLGKRVPILQDLPGPKLRVGEIAPGTRYKRGDRVTVTPRPVVGNSAVIPVSYAKLPREVVPGDVLLLKDGEIELVVVSRRADRIVCRVRDGGSLVSHQGLNAPTARLSLPAVTPADRRHLRWGVAHGVDWMAVSFVKTAADIERVRRLVVREAPPARRPRIVAKIEKHEAVEDLESIVAAADAVMVARGDLGVEIDPARVPFVQKRVIRWANRLGKPVITATQMFESMLDHPRPTRAEVSDVANAVLDGTDAVMLSEETAVGQYPVAAVRAMRHVLARAERETGRSSTGSGF